MKDNIVKVGDRVLAFDYTNTEPKFFGTCIAASEHFIRIKGDGFNAQKLWYARANTEIFHEKDQTN